MVVIRPSCGCVARLDETVCTKAKVERGRGRASVKVARADVASMSSQ
jgi:hypothetical protein